MNCDVQEETDDCAEDSPGNRCIPQDKTDYVKGRRPRQENQPGQGKKPRSIESSLDPIGHQPQQHNGKAGTDPEKYQE